MELVGILGGAFNPPHNEHIRISKELLKEFGLSKVMLVPTKDAPHKTTSTPFDKRCRMIELVINDIENLHFDRIEETIIGTTYSHIVLRALKVKYQAIAFIIGGDSMINFASWRCPEKIIKICPIIVVARGDITQDLLDSIERYRALGADIKLAKTIGEEVSSSLVRAHIEFGLDTSRYISKECREYIEYNNLYKEHKEIINRVKKNMTPKRFEHTVSTTLTAIKLNDTWGIDFDKLFVAALLHDCMKDSDIIHEGVPKDTINTKVMHAFNGAIEAQKRYNIEDEDILNAIRYHTTGRPAMSNLEKLIYLADMIEPLREIEDLEEIREVAYKDAEAGFLSTLKSAYRYLKKYNRNIYYLTEDCYNYYYKGDNE